jgi:hypothetical protein
MMAKFISFEASPLHYESILVNVSMQLDIIRNTYIKVGPPSRQGL